jgi:hypothetical protein
MGEIWAEERLWVRVEDERGAGNGKLVLLARLGLSNAVGRPRKRRDSSCSPRRQRLWWQRSTQSTRSAVKCHLEFTRCCGRHIQSIFTRCLISHWRTCPLPAYIAVYLSTGYGVEDFPDERQIQVFEHPGELRCHYSSDSLRRMRPSKLHSNLYRCSSS